MSPYDDEHAPAPAGAGRPRDEGERREFAETLREAVRSQGLTLERIRDRLAARGIRLSPVTLSHWQRGRSRPERPSSLRAVHELEHILGLADGALVSLLTPPPRRGAALLPAPDSRAIEEFYGPDSTLQRLIGAPLEQYNAHLRSVSLRETIHLDRRGYQYRQSVTHVCRAVRDGVDRLLVVHNFDDLLPAAVDISVDCGLLGSLRFDRAVHSLVAEIRFGRPLAKGETALVEYALHLEDCASRGTYHERRMVTRMRDYLLHIRFHPDAVPEHCVAYYRERLDGGRQKVRHIGVDAFHGLHFLPSACDPGVHGVSWQWPGRRRDGEPGVRSEDRGAAGGDRGAGAAGAPQAGG